MDEGFCCGLRTATAYKPMVHSLGSKFKGEMRETSTSCLFGQKELFREGELGSKDSSSVIDTDGVDSLFMYSKPGRFLEFENARNDKRPRETSSLSVASTVPAKKIRSAGLNSQIPFCQVLGCNKDLSSSKDYYKRHKVCVIHSKTEKVIVNAKEQRFCQQCSRFHLLAEFDNGKRSCRRRLAGHNERRRKPRLGIDSGRNAKFLPCYYALSPFHTANPPTINGSSRSSQIAGSWNHKPSMANVLSCKLSVLTHEEPSAVGGFLAT